jgi:biopolymer transport protein ExbB
MNIAHITDLANDSGGVLYVIAVMLFVALTIIIERYWYLHRVTGSGRDALEQLDHLNPLNAATLASCAEQFDNLPTGRLMKTAANLAGQTTREELGACLDEAIMREAPRIDRLLWVLDTIVTLAPLLGLFGTIVGMFNAFQVLSNPGNAPTQVTGGVAEALIATASGLFVAMIGLVFFNGLHNRVRSVVHQLEIVKAALVNRLAGTSLETSKAVREAPRAVVGKLASQGV